MLSLLERNVAAIESRLVLLSPSDLAAPAFFKNVTVDSGERRRLIEEMQRLRGDIYLTDGAVQRDQLSPDGLHRTPEDERSWHLLMRHQSGRINACVWYLEHESATSMNELRVRNCPLNGSPESGRQLQSAIEGELARTERDHLRYVEVGGWAVAKEGRCSAEGLLLALAAYSLGRLFGGALGLTTATVRHSSSTILRRLGGTDLEAGGTIVPSYFDPRYECQMELLRFDSRRPSPRYSRLIDLLKERLANVSVIAHAARSSAQFAA